MASAHSPVEVLDRPKIGHLVADADGTLPDLVLPDVVCVCPPDAPREVWEAERFNGLGGSDIAAACGIHRYTSPYTLWAEKTGRPTPVRSEKSLRAMRWGNLIEPVLRDEFQWQHPEVVVTPPPGTLAVPSALWQRVNVDGLVWHPDGRLAAVLEVKIGSHYQLVHWEHEDEVPVAYTAQVQWAMHITGAPVAWVVGLLDSHTYLERLIVRDDELIADLVELGTAFWSQVLDDTPPDVDGTEGTRETLARVQQREGSSVVLDSAEWGPKLARRLDLHRQIGALDAAKAALDNELRAAMGEHTEAKLDGEKVATHRKVKPQRRCDYDRLLADFPAAYNACVTTDEDAGRRLDHSRSKAAAGVLAAYTGSEG